MAKFLAQCALSMVVLSLASLGLATRPYPLGVHFGPENISAALIQEDGEPLLVAHITATDAYHNLVVESVGINPPIFLNTLCESWLVDYGNETKQSEGPARVPEFEMVFTENLLMIKDEATKVLGNSVDISSISAVNSFNQTVRQAIRHSAAENLDQQIPYWRVSSPEYGSFYRHNLHICHGPGWKVEDDEPFPRELKCAYFIDYNYEYLDLSFSMTASACTEEYSNPFEPFSLPMMRRPDLGAKRLEQAQTQEEIDIYHIELQDTFYNLIATHFCNHKHSFDPKSRKAYNIGSLHFDLLKAIIISGEAPKSATQYLRNIVLVTVPDLADRLSDEVAPNWVGAVGAAQLAKVQIDTPSIFKDTNICIFESEDAEVKMPGEHDEL